ncbi:hypothetical protein GNZ10_17835 [Ralstonia sp. 3N]|nr:hypothetical protein HMPREF1004_01878 [Ralstonia pickettii]EGY64966.2 hypothetical protein HMPREF0989_01934 [Ralstonia sp. 5_2_56FAA]MBU6522470.1 hypothetical protein [Ralstonia sp. B265]NPT51556.1 hypothetical protein [Ralstonia sp. 3N]SCW96485.1 hypothetical protein SAMN02799637_04214 [Ralstonia sp. UNCCL144]
MTLRMTASLLGGALWLAGCAQPYVEPPAGARTVPVEFIRPASGAAAALLVFDDARTCTGQRVAIATNQPARSVRVLTDVPTTMAVNFVRPAGNLTYFCSVAVSFVPLTGHRYQLRSTYSESERGCRAALIESSNGLSWRPVAARYRQWATQSACQPLTDADIAHMRDRTRSEDGSTTLSDLKDLLLPQ